MAIKRGRPFTGDLVGLSAVPAILSRLIGVTRKRETIYTWVKKGKVNQHGTRVKLRTYIKLGRFYTTEEAVIEFLKESE